MGIAARLRAGADMVVTGRVTDAALVIGPAAAHFGWAPRRTTTRLAGAVVAGHLMECGAQATGGNYAFFTEIARRASGTPASRSPRLHADGSSVITKHPGTGGAVTVGTVTAQLLYEIGGARLRRTPTWSPGSTPYGSSQQGPDRVAVERRARRGPRPPTLKVGLNRLGGFRNAVAFVLTGLDIEAKADLVRAQTGSRPRHDHRRPLGPWPAPTGPTPPTEETASAPAAARRPGRRPARSCGRGVERRRDRSWPSSGYPGSMCWRPPPKGAPVRGLRGRVRPRMEAVDHAAVPATTARA